jgi:hypothetical protein
MENTNEQVAALITGLDTLGWKFVSLTDQSANYNPINTADGTLTIMLTIKKL